MEATAPEVVVDAAGTTEVEGEQSEVFSPSDVEYISYGGEHHLPLIMGLVDQELSEPYSIFTYRYFVYLWPNLTFLAFHRGRCVGTVVSKIGEHRNTFRGYIAMLVVIKPYRGRGIATELVTRSIRVMMESGCEEGTSFGMTFVPNESFPALWFHSVPLRGVNNLKSPRQEAFAYFVLCPPLLSVTGKDFPAPGRMALLVDVRLAGPAC
ncbi:N-alpha-acetyltransferase MAK3 [Curcuma longa]|uniref:N-alpha-acetyltransferase MAK3 n=1 Tax=Curcuma longa TaxID=136217 RepID=UPI003D9E939B